MSSTTSIPPAKRKSDDIAVDNHYEFFIPKKKEVRNFGRTTLMLYPDVTSDMPDQERSLAFQTNSDALKNSRAIKYQQKLAILGEGMGCSTLVEIELGVFKNSSFDSLKHNQNLTVLSYHNSQGLAINDCLTVGGDLKPIADGPIPNCRPTDICYAKVTTNLDFTAMDPAARPLSFTFFIKLPMTDQIVNNGNGIPYDLRTFAGPSNYMIIDQDEYHTLIYDHVDAIEEPFILKPPDFTSPDAIIDIETPTSNLEELICKVAWPILIGKIFRRLCPNFLSDPYKTLNSIKQTNTINGVLVTSTIRQYNDRTTIVLATFDKHLTAWPTNPFRSWVDNIDPEIKNKMEQNGFRTHTTAVSNTPRDQINYIQQAYEAATLAEKELNQQKSFISTQLRGVQGFMTRVIEHAPQDETMALQSAANDTIAKHGVKNACWGCGDTSHAYFDRRSKKVVCPRSDEPEVKAKADATWSEYKEKQKLRRAKRSKGTKSLLTTMQSLMEQVAELKSLKATSSTPGTHVLHTFVSSFKASNLPQLPITIHPTLPHIHLKLGSDTDTFQPAISAIVDSGSALCTGDSDYVMGIAEAYPQLVQSITLAADRYSPIILSGVISNSENPENYTTNLPCIVEFRLPYVTTSGSPTTLKIAVGKDVGVNCLIGMSFLKEAKMIIDLNDDVVQSGLLDTDPFPLIHKRPTRSMPNLIPIEGSIDKSLPIMASIIQAKEYIHNTPSAPAPFTGMTSLPPSGTTFSAADILRLSSRPPAGSNKRSVTLMLDPHTADITEPSHDIIRVQKRKRGKKPENLYEEPDVIDINGDFEFLHEPRVGKVIRKSTRPPLTDADCNPDFISVEYNELSDGPFLRKHLNIGLKTPEPICTAIITLIQEYWCCFAECNVKIPITGYECFIDTGKGKPTVARNIHYGLHETPIMQAAIDALLDNQQISVNIHSDWLSKAVLAAKPHQEHVTNITEFIWRFCINYIAVNQKTRILSYFIPRCDDAVERGFGLARLFFLLDACSGYHQILMEKASKNKTAFAGPYGRKYVYNVMPFGIVNAPTIYTIMIYDLKDSWDNEAIKFEITIDENNNSTIIIDDNFCYVTSYENGLGYLKAILTVARRHSLSWKLKKCFFFPDKVEFVGHDITDIGNCPADSKSPLLKSWPKPKIIRDVSSYVSFTLFYSQYIPYFEQRSSALRAIIKIAKTGKDYDIVVTDAMWTEEAESQFHDIRNAILSKPILRRVSRQKRCYLLTDFSSVGMGCVLGQPEDTEESMAAMKSEDAGGECKFELTLDGPRLLPCSFGSRACRANEKFLHSYVGEAKAMQFGYHRNYHVLYARPFTHIGDCLGSKYILFYTGNNHVILRLQLEFMGWWMTTVHRNRNMNIAADYFSYLGADVCIDPLLNQYMKLADTERKTNPPAAAGPTLADENLPNFRGKRTEPPSSHSHIPAPCSLLIPHTPIACQSVTNVPIQFHSEPANFDTKKFHSSPAAHAAFQLLHQSWIVYGFSSGHFFHTCRQLAENINVTLAADPNQLGRAMFHTYGNTPHIFDSAFELLDVIRTDYSVPTQGYYITAPPETNTSKQKAFLQIQSTIIDELHQRVNLHAFILQIPSDYSLAPIKLFQASLKGWTITREYIHYPSLGDCIDASCIILFGIHIGITGNEQAIQLIRPPYTPTAIENHIYKHFDSDQYKMSNHPSASPDEADQDAFEIKQVEEEASQPHGHITLNYLLKKGDTPNSLVGARVCSRVGTAPPLEPLNFNPFGRLFGITYSDPHDNCKTRIISAYEYCQCWQMDPNLVVQFAQDIRHIDLLETALPSKTSRAVIEAMLSTLTDIRLGQSELVDSSSEAAPAATARAFLSGATILKLPQKATWKLAYSRDPETKLMIEMIQNPSLIKKENLNNLHYIYRQPMRDSQILLIDDILYIREKTDIAENFLQLQIVPSELRNIIFTAFHANPIGEHFDLYHTFHKIRLRYFWPGMWKYVNHLISCCAGCLLGNARSRKSTTLVYSFPIDMPWVVIHADVYTVGVDQGFSGEKSFMNMLCGMCGFAAIEGLRPEDINSTGFAKVIMKACLRLGLPHTIVIDKDSKFRATFEDTMNLLSINLHTASGGNHDPILTERFHVFTNKALRIFCNERDSNRVVAEGMNLIGYAWNSAPVTGTDISRSLVCLGREFKFPIEYANQPYTNIIFDASSTVNFVEVQKRVLSQSREIFKILIHEHRAMHREYMNARRPDPLIYSIGDRVFARRAVQSVRSKGRVQKTQIKHTGPWIITEILKGSSYRIKHCKTDRIDKKHAAHLTPCPIELIPFPPLAGPDTSYGMIHRPIKKDPFLEASIESYNPASVWSEPPDNASNPVSSLLAFIQKPEHTFPSLAELNEDLDHSIFGNMHFESTHQNPHVTDKNNHEVLTPNPSINMEQTRTGPLCLINQPQVTFPPKSTFSINSIMVNLIRSEAKLLFISYSSPYTEYLEWKLVQVDMEYTLNHNPNAISDGRVYVNFLISHPDDRRYSGPNQRYWTEYHELHGRFASIQNYHLVRPSPNRAQYAKQKNLVPFSIWITLNESNYIHGPFDFAIIHGRRSRDRISTSDWIILRNSKSKFQNTAPFENKVSFTFSYHVNTLYHSIHSDKDTIDRMNAVATYNYMNAD